MKKLILLLITITTFIDVSYSSFPVPEHLETASVNCVDDVDIAETIVNVLENLDHFKNLVEDINTYFIDSTIESLEISNYYDKDFIFYSYPAGYKQGIKTSKLDYIKNIQHMND